jgi:predicted HTH domain antitoxin
MLKEQPQFTVSLPNSLRPFVEKLGTGSSLDDKIKISVVIGLFTGNVVTLERAAELTNHSVSDFIDVLHSRGIPWMGVYRRTKTAG